MKYKTQNGWTKEKMIEHILSNFLGKSHKLRDSTSCLYRGPNGRKCAVGMFIPQKKYHSEMESFTAEYVMRTYDLAADMPLTKYGMLGLQDQHDDADNDEDCLNRMLDFIDDNVED